MTLITTVRLSFSWLRFRFDKIGVLSLSGLFSISISRRLFESVPPPSGGFHLMNEGRTVFAQLLDFLPKYEFDKCVARYRGNFRVRKLPAYEQFPAQFGWWTPWRGRLSLPIRFAKRSILCDVDNLFWTENEVGVESYPIRWPWVFTQHNCNKRHFDWPVVCAQQKTQIQNINLWKQPNH